MRDPGEGLDASGMITTGVARSRVHRRYEPVVSAALDATDAAALYLYGSVATGMATSSSDVDLLAIGLAPAEAARLALRLSEQFASLCRGVEIGTASKQDFDGDSDSAYGNRVFLRHYCVNLRGDGPPVSRQPFPGDIRAARGFNGDIAEHLAVWRGDAGASTTADAGSVGRRVARKTLLAVAGLVSIHDRTWTTDRDSSTRRMIDLHPQFAVELQRLIDWSNGVALADTEQLALALASEGVVSWVAREFADVIGLHRPERRQE